jgi:6-pyruvoyltetrahydropterin/6-carboxytetrahydropterin synthase
MFDLEKIFHFEAGHSLTLHDGKCRHPHGHSYILTIHIQSEELIQSGPKTNMVMDFSEITSIVNPMISQYFDHHWMNDTLKTDSPTVEFMAQWIYHYLKPHLPKLHAITLNETATSKVRYSPQEKSSRI